MFETIFASAGLLLLVAVLSEALTEILRNLFSSTVRDKVTYALSIIIGIGLSFAFELNLFGLIGTGEYVSIIAAGILASRGANYINGFLKRIQVLK